MAQTINNNSERDAERKQLDAYVEGNYQSLLHTKHTNERQMDHRSKLKSKNDNIFRGNHRKKSLRLFSRQRLLRMQEA